MSSCSPWLSFRFHWRLERALSLGAVLGGALLGCTTESDGRPTSCAEGSAGGKPSEADADERDRASESSSDGRVEQADARSESDDVERWGEPRALAECPDSTDIPDVPAPAPDRTTVDLDSRVRALVQRMSLEEKATQLGNTTPAIERLGLPAYQYWNEALHGVVDTGTTSFPVPLALGATWDPDLLRSVASAISDEARALSNTRRRPSLTYFSPTINILRDPRWGRAEETYGEDPHLLSRMAVAFVQGMQGDDPVYLKTVATAKHYLANNYEEGRISTSSDVDERTLREYYTPHFRAAVKEGGVFSVMAAYNAVNGVPMVDSRRLLVDLLRGEWHFPGYVVSDCGAVAYSYEDHGYASSYASAAALALNAGTNLECVLGESVYQNHLLEAVDDGSVTEATIDDALFRVLRGRFLLGEFDPKDAVPFTRTDGSVLENAEHEKLARRAAQESIVLLKNESHILPLGDDLPSLAVVGPYADRVVLGGYSGTPTRTISILTAIRNRLPSADILTSDSGSPSEVAAVAARANAAVLVLGTDQDFAAEGRDAHSLDLPRPQSEMARAVVQANPNTVVVLMAGHPVSFGSIADTARAILYGWYAGEQGGQAVTDVLFGDQTPAGRLPLTLYASISQLPSITNYSVRGDDSAGIGRTYQYFDENKFGSVLYAFGHGLSYTTFAYDSLDLCGSDPTTLLVRARVTNEGDRGGDEVVQLYVTDRAAGQVRPIRSLAGFRRVHLDPGASTSVPFRVSLDDLGFWDANAGRLRVRPGPVRIELGASSRDIRLSTTVATDGSSFLH